MLISNPSFGRALARRLPGGDVDLQDMSPAELPGATRRPHVCFVAPQAWPVLAGDANIEVVGGAEVQQCMLARLLAHAGYRVSMICLDYGQPQRTGLDGITVVRTYRPGDGIPVLRFIHPRLTGIWRAMREVDADIYYQRAAGVLTATVAEFCRRHGKRSIYAGADDGDFIPGRQAIRYRRDRWLFERGLAAVDAVIVQNETQQGDCLAHYGRASTIIPSCYDLPADACPGTGEYVLWVATLRPDKRPELLLELARRLPQRRFVMVGGVGGDDPGDIEYFDTIRRAAGPLPNVEFTGFLPPARAEPYFDRALVVVNTSTSEGMPNVFLQAWARGVPTLAFVDIGTRLTDKPVVHVVADADAAADEIERMFTDDIYRAHAAARCREYFAVTHASTDVLARFSQLLDALVSGDKR